MCFARRQSWRGRTSSRAGTPSPPPTSAPVTLAVACEAGLEQLEAVLRDVLERWVSARAAHDVYGTVLAESGPGGELMVDVSWLRVDGISAL